MKTTFTEAFNYDFTILDRFNKLCDFELVETNKKYNIYDLQCEEFLFGETDLTIQEIMEIWTEKAYNYFKEEYIENMGNLLDNEDFDRQKLYLAELQLIKRHYLGVDND